MKSLKDKGVVELKGLKNRVARLYGMGRMTNEAFNRRMKKILNLEEDLNEDKPIETEQSILS